MLTMSQKRFETEGSLPEFTPQDENEERSCLSIYKILFTATQMEKMPKQVVLALTMKTLYRGKDISTMLNPNGHCINYWESLEIDAAWANDICSDFTSSDGYYKSHHSTKRCTGVFCVVSS